MTLIVRKLLKTYSLKNFFWVFFLLSAVFSCGEETQKEKILIGSWQAKWTIRATSNDSSTQPMDGKFIFYKNGEVMIEAYGFDGCPFACDTLSNTLHWKLEENVLHIIDKNDESGIPYHIDKFSEKQIQLVLLDDIYLTLNRVCP